MIMIVITCCICCSEHIDVQLRVRVHQPRQQLPNPPPPTFPPQTAAPNANSNQKCRQNFAAFFPPFECDEL